MQEVKQELLLAHIRLERACDAFYRLEPSLLRSGACALTVHAGLTIKEALDLLKREEKQTCGKS